MRRILKFTLPIHGPVIISGFVKPFSVGCDGEAYPVIWCECEEHQPNEDPTTLEVVWTGEEAPEKPYVGTFQAYKYGNLYVGHVFITKKGSACAI